MAGDRAPANAPHATDRACTWTVMVHRESPGGAVSTRAEDAAGTSSAGPGCSYQDAGGSESGPDILVSREAGGHVIRGSALRLGGSFAGIALGVITASLLLRHLGVSESGRYVTVTSLVAIATTVADAGLNVTGSRDLALRPAGARRALVSNLLGL